jgi:sensor histidine kinase YesM
LFLLCRPILIRMICEIYENTFNRFIIFRILKSFEFLYKRSITKMKAYSITTRIRTRSSYQIYLRRRMTSLAVLSSWYYVGV